MAQQAFILSEDELDRLAYKIVERLNRPDGEAAVESPAKEFVYGLRGIANLFNVSLPMAQQYKNTFLAPAVMQRGRKLITDKWLAIELYKNR